MSEFCCNSQIRIEPSKLACTIPGLMTTRSPAFTEISSNISSNLLLFAFSTYCSGEIPSFIPITNLASSLAEITYQHSALPKDFSIGIA